MTDQQLLSQNISDETLFGIMNNYAVRVVECARYVKGYIREGKFNLVEDAITSLEEEINDLKDSLNEAERRANITSLPKAEADTTATEPLNNNIKSVLAD